MIDWRYHATHKKYTLCHGLDGYIFGDNLDLPKYKPSLNYKLMICIILMEKTRQFININYRIISVDFVGSKPNDLISQIGRGPWVRVDFIREIMLLQPHVHVAALTWLNGNAKVYYFIFKTRNIGNQNFVQITTILKLSGPIDNQSNSNETCLKRLHLNNVATKPLNKRSASVILLYTCVHIISGPTRISAVQDDINLIKLSTTLL